MLCLKTTYSIRWNLSKNKMILTTSRTHCRKQWGQTAQRFASTSKIEMPLESGQPDQGNCRHRRAAATFVKLPLRRMMDVVTGSRNMSESTSHKCLARLQQQVMNALMDAATVLETFFVIFSSQQNK